MSGRGAWPFTYKLGTDFRSDPNGRDANGLMAFKRELIYNGYTQGIVPTLPYYGTSVASQAKLFQTANKLTPDGEIGPTTAKYLFVKRMAAQEVRYGVPNPWLNKVATVESANDPVAQGFVDPNDEGLMQIHLSYYPDVTTFEAWDPAFSIPWGAAKLASNITYCKGDIPGGVAAYNIGRFYALEWVNAGHPASGGPLIGGVDSFARATQYYSLVSKA